MKGGKKGREGESGREGRRGGKERVGGREGDGEGEEREGRRERGKEGGRVHEEMKLTSPYVESIEYTSTNPSAVLMYWSCMVEYSS